MSKSVKSVARRIKHIVTGEARKMLRVEIANQKKLIEQQQHVITQLQDRNDEWEHEVREMRRQDQPMHIVWPISRKEIIKALPRNRHKAKSGAVSSAKNHLTIAWVGLPMGPVSGGYTTILRAIAGLESRGHTCVIYIYDSEGTSSYETVMENLKAYPKVAARIVYNPTHIDDCDVLFATSWYSAYPVYNARVTAKKFYFIQDFEPMFSPADSYATLADNTYKFGFHGITLGSWMKKRLESQYGMTCDNFDLGVSPKEYSLENTAERRRVVFYARPDSPRRGFELGILALEVFHKEHPEYEIDLVGWDVSRYDIPFQYINHGIIDIPSLNKLYNQAAAGLVLSLTNMSLLPLELMGSGCIPVVNRSETTTDVGYNKYIEYADPTPLELAEGLSRAIEAAKNGAYIHEMSRYTRGFSWNDFNHDFEEAIKKALT